MKIATLMTAAALTLAAISSAEARGRRVAIAPECNVTMPCLGATGGKRAEGGAIDRVVGRASTSLANVERGLANKVRAIINACPGTRVISSIRFTRIAGGGGAMSRHASGNAVDVAAPRHNYSCIYANLHDWPSYSTDGRRCRHVHISNGEGRFRHYRC